MTATLAVDPCLPLERRVNLEEVDVFEEIDFGPDAVDIFLEDSDPVEPAMDCA